MGGSHQYCVVELCGNSPETQPVCGWPEYRFEWNVRVNVNLNNVDVVVVFFGGHAL